jgi:hypothetical protein
MARLVTRLVGDRPWLGWRHRRSMARYLGARRRNAVLLTVGQGGYALVDLFGGNLLGFVLLGAGTAHLAHRHRNLFRDPSVYEPEWQQVRDRLAETDAARRRGEGRRLPSARSAAFLFLTPVAIELLFTPISPWSWPTQLLLGALVGAVLVAGDVLLHLRHAPVLDLVPPEQAPAFPIADYEVLTVRQILPLLGSLSAEQLAAVADEERAGKGRRSILDRVERELIATT